MAAVFKCLKDGYDENQSLVKVLKNGNYKLAAEMIMDPVNGPTYLNEAGDRGVKPLSMVLFGDLPSGLIHLYLAKLMVERGVDVNCRIRDVEYMSMSSCFEQLIKVLLYVNENLRADCFQIPHLIGVNNQPVKTLTEARIHLIELLKVFLEFGGNPNFRTRAQGCTLFHKILKCRIPDEEVIHILYRSGGDINKAPRIGFPPVVSLINNSFCDNALPIVKQIWTPAFDEISIRAGPGSARSTTVANSALMVAMHTASTASALFFLEQGAQFDTVRIYDLNNGNREVVSCLFLPILYQSLPYFKYYAAVTLNTNDNYLKNYVFSDIACVRNVSAKKECNKSLICKVVSSSVSPVVDAVVEMSSNLVTQKEIEHIISKFTSYDAEFFFQQCSFTSTFSALFGQSTTTLQQLCVRSIFDNTFFNKPTLDTQKLIHGLKYPAYSDKPYLAEFVIRNVKSMVNDINDVVVKNLLECLRLPSKLNILFQLEAARLQVFMNLNAFECLEEFGDVPSRTGSRNSLSSENICGSDGSVDRMETDSELDDDDGNDDDDDEDDDDDSDSTDENDESEWDSSSDDFSQDTSTPSNDVGSRRNHHHCSGGRKHHDSGAHHDDSDKNDDYNSDVNDCNCFVNDNDDEEFSQSYNELSEVSSSSADSESLSLT